MRFWTRANTRRRLKAGLREARRRNRGLHVADWTVAADAAPLQLIAWAREVLASCRRPLGISHFDLTVALASEAGARVIRWRRLLPEDLWRDDGPLSSMLTPGDGASELRIKASLFSWGDAAHYALSR